MWHKEIGREGEIVMGCSWKDIVDEILQLHQIWGKSLKKNMFFDYKMTSNAFVAPPDLRVATVSVVTETNRSIATLEWQSQGLDTGRGNLHWR